MKKNKKIIFITIFLISIVLTLGVIRGVTYSWFKASNVFDYYLKSKGFYFSSNELGEEIVKNINNSWNGDKVYFTLRNNLNQSVITSYDISYNVTCEVRNNPNISCELNNKGTSFDNATLSSIQICENNSEDGVDVSEYTKIECEQGGYDYVDVIAEGEMYFELIPDEGYEIKDVIVEVEAVSTSPYSKKLKGEFQLTKSNVSLNSINMTYNNYSNYGRLNINNLYNENKYITITWDSSNIQIDSTDYLKSTLNNNYINQICLQINPNSNKSYRFYSNNTINVQEFTLSEVNSCD